MRCDFDSTATKELTCQFFEASNGVVANHSAVGGALSVTYDDVFIYSTVYYEKNVKIVIKMEQEVKVI